MADDMFEKAREAFFGTSNIIPKAHAPSGESLKLGTESSPKEFIGPSSDEREASSPPNS